MASVEVKQISSSCKTCMRITVSVYKKYANQCLRICTFACMYDMESGCEWVSFKPLNAGNNQLTIVGAFSDTETCSFPGSQTCTHERFRGSK